MLFKLTITTTNMPNKEKDLYCCFFLYLIRQVTNNNYNYNYKVQITITKTITKSKKTIIVTKTRKKIIT